MPITHSFIISDANEYGLQAAVILYHLRYLQAAHVDRGTALHDGKHWVNYSYESLAKTFQYMSVQTIKRVMSKLVKAGAIEKEPLNMNRFNRELSWHCALSEIDLSSVSKTNYAESGIGLSDSSESDDVIHTSNIKQKTYTHKGFEIPTVIQIQDYSSTIDAERFYDFYESKGWLIGKNKMKCWKSAVRNWERNNEERNNKSTISSNPRQPERKLTPAERTKQKYFERFGEHLGHRISEKDVSVVAEDERNVWTQMD